MRNDVKDLLLTFHDEPKFLIDLGNKCFEHQQMLTRLRSWQTYASVLVSPPLGPMQVLNPIPFDGPSPMEIEAAC